MTFPSRAVKKTIKAFLEYSLAPSGIRTRINNKAVLSNTMTDIGDVILVFFEDQPAFFGRIEDIYSDTKPGWFRMKFLILQVPLALGEWILRTEYIQGEEFTMGGKKVRIERVAAPAEEQPPAAPGPPGKVIPLRKDRKDKP